MWTDQDDQLGHDVHGIDPTGDDIPVWRSLPSRRQRSGTADSTVRTFIDALGRTVLSSANSGSRSSVLRAAVCARLHLRPAGRAGGRLRAGFQRRSHPARASRPADELHGHVREILKGFVRPAAEAGNLELPKAQGAELEGRIIGCNVVTLSV